MFVCSQYEFSVDKSCCLRAELFACFHVCVFAVLRVCVLACLRVCACIIILVVVPSLRLNSVKYIDEPKTDFPIS